MQQALHGGQLGCSLLHRRSLPSPCNFRASPSRGDQQQPGASGTRRQCGLAAAVGCRSPAACQRPRRVQLRAATAAAADGQAAERLPDGSVSVVLLAGGVGKRMGAAIPKQYLDLLGQPIATYSLQTFAAMREVGEIVVVCVPDYRDMFEQCYNNLQRKVPLKFALPGAERQDSVYNGFQAIRADAAVVAIHDSARPLVTPEDASRCFQDGWRVGAAVLGVPVKPTIKRVDKAGRVLETLRRADLWEVQTPQVVRPALLREGFELVAREGLEVTDDVSIIEALGKPVQITSGSYTNIKVTTPDDMSVAERFLSEQQSQRQPAAVPA